MPKRITNAQFVERLKEVNPALEPLGEYRGMKGVVEVLCHDCGQTFSMEARRLLENGTCSEHGDRRALVREALRARNAAGAKTQAQFEEEVSQANPGFSVTGAYEGCDAKVPCSCPRGHGLSVKATLLARPGYQCPECKREDAWARKDAAFRAWLAGANPRIVPLEPFRGDTVAISFRCEDCGEPFDAEPRLLRRAAACPNCGARPKKGPARLSHDEFVARVAKASPEVTVVGAYVNEDTKVACACERGHRWDAEPRNLLRGAGCKRCADERRGLGRRIPHDEFVARVRELSPELEVLGRYEGSDERVAVRCAACGRSWEPYAGHLLAGHGCPCQAHVQTSFAEQYVLLALRASLGEGAVLSRDTEAIGAELDVYVPSRRLAAEVGSWPWHKQSLARDAGKRALAEAAGIDLVTVYTDCHEAEPPLDGCLCYAEDLGQARSLPLLERLADDIVGRAGGRPLSRDEHAAIAAAAHAAARRATPEEFAGRVREASGGTIEVVGTYTKSSEPVACRCAACGHEWSPTANNLLRRLRCPKCGKGATA